MPEDANPDRTHDLPPVTPTSASGYPHTDPPAATNRATVAGMPRGGRALSDPGDLPAFRVPKT